MIFLKCSNWSCADDFKGLDIPCVDANAKHLNTPKHILKILKSVSWFSHEASGGNYPVKKTFKQGLPLLACCSALVNNLSFLKLVRSWMNMVQDLKKNEEPNVHAYNKSKGIWNIWNMKYIAEETNDRILKRAFCWKRRIWNTNAPTFVLLVCKCVLYRAEGWVSPALPREQLCSGTISSRVEKVITARDTQPARC